ncbi:hypothetical protein JW872_02480 [Candidatus Babeliales bacterium]|nr:hypothetical protein [Candidatus Babeliales bacterium]
MFDDTISDRQVVVSLELVKLIEWILEHENEGLRRLINRAVFKGMTANKPSQDFESLDDMNQYIVNFLSKMEVFLDNAVEQQLRKTLKKNDIIPAVRHIDTTSCDTSFIEHTIERITNKLPNPTNASPKELLLKELLKRWNPGKNCTLN